MPYSAIAINRLNDFHAAITSNKAIAFDGQGNWTTRFGIIQKIRTLLAPLFGFDDTTDIANNFRKFLKYQTVPSTTIKAGLQIAQQHDIQKYEEIAASIRARLVDKIQTEEVNINELRTFKKRAKQELNQRVQDADSTKKKELELDFRKIKIRLSKLRASSKHTVLMNAIEREILALKTQCTPSPSSPQEKEENINIIRIRYNTWKEIQSPTLILDTKKEERIFSRLEGYPDLAKHLRKDPISRELFFKFIFRNMRGESADGVDVFACFPSLQKRLSTAYIDSRIGAVGKGLLFRDPSESSTGKADVLLKMHGQDISILDVNKEIQLGDKGSTTVRTIHQIFKAFKEQNARIPEVEFYPSGVEFMNTSKFPFDFSKEKWWQTGREPKILSREQVLKEYTDITRETLNQSEALFVTMASRQRPTLEPGENHGWIRILVSKDEKKEAWEVLSLGKFADTYPEPAPIQKNHGLFGKIAHFFKSFINFIKTFAFTFKTFNTALMDIDVNETYFQRERAAICYPIKTQERFLKLRDILRETSERVKKGNDVFQAQGTNCSAWVQEVFDKLFHDIEEKERTRLFETHLSELSGIPGPLRIFTQKEDDLSERKARIISTVRSFIGKIFGAAQGKEVTIADDTQEYRSLLNNRNWQKGLLSIPGKIFLMKQRPVFKQFYAKYFSVSSTYK